MRVFTTRPDTLFGATYMVLAPEHPLLDSVTTAEHAAAVKEYVVKASTKSDLERTELQKVPTPNPKPQTPNPEPRTPDPGPRTPDPEPRTPNPGPRTPDPGPRTQQWNPTMDVTGARVYAGQDRALHRRLRGQPPNG